MDMDYGVKSGMLLNEDPAAGNNQTVPRAFGRAGHGHLIATRQRMFPGSMNPALPPQWRGLYRFAECCYPEKETAKQAALGGLYRLLPAPPEPRIWGIGGEISVRVSESDRQPGEPAWLMSIFHD